MPGDDSQVMYVWTDALSNYITVLGYPEKDISDYWPAAVQFVGKDILRFHTIIWPSILLGLGLPLPKVIHSHGFILSNGQKMAKSIGNVVNPVDVLEKHGTEAFRYYFSRHIDTFVDADFTWEKFEAAYNNELANDLGNLVQRLATMAAKNQITLDAAKPEYSKEYTELMDNFQFSKAIDSTWTRVQSINKQIDEQKPWELAKKGEKDRLESVLKDLISQLLNANFELAPFLPETAKKIEAVFAGGEGNPPKTPLFPKD